MNQIKLIVRYEHFIYRTFYLNLVQISKIINLYVIMYARNLSFTTNKYFQFPIN